MPIERTLILFREFCHFNAEWYSHKRRIHEGNVGFLQSDHSADVLLPDILCFLLFISCSWCGMRYVLLPAI
jgi:hypothetical protein